MKGVIFPAILALAASNTFAQYTNQSAPFYLVVLSSNLTLNGTNLQACHEGAAIEGLCPGPPPSGERPSYTIFQFNTSSSPHDVNQTIGDPGILTYSLVSGNIQQSEAMGLAFNPTSNVAVPEFTPGYDWTVAAFDCENKLNIQGYVDDTKLPFKYGDAKAYYRWYVCETYAGYDYTTLAWVMGNRSPENPSCVKVDILRVFI